MKDFTDTLIKEYLPAEKAAWKDYNAEQKKIAGVERELNDIAKELDQTPAHVKKIMSMIDEEHISKAKSEGILGKIASMLKRAEVKWCDGYIMSSYWPKEYAETRPIPVRDDPKMVARQAEGYIDYMTEYALPKERLRALKDAEPYYGCETRGDFVSRTMALLDFKRRIESLKIEVPGTTVEIEPSESGLPVKAKVTLGEMTRQELGDFRVSCRKNRAEWEERISHYGYKPFRDAGIDLTFELSDKASVEDAQDRLANALSTARGWGRTHYGGF